MPIPQHCHNNDGCFYTNCKRCKLEHAAPDLLAACEALVEMAPKLWGDDPGEHPRIMDRIEAAIAKAKE